MERTQRYAFQKEKRNAIQTRVYCQFPNLIAIIGLLIGAFFFAVLAQFKFGKRLLERVSIQKPIERFLREEITLMKYFNCGFRLLQYPKLFSLGLCSHEGPSKEDMNKTKFTFTLVAKGWSDSRENHDEPPNKTKILKVRGVNPAYGATVTMFLQSAVTIINEMDRMPSK